ncbi:ribokinase [soil metagenome]
MGRVIVVGSLNVDLVVRAPTLPAPGQTVAGDDLARHQGGKGGNQAVAAARLGAEVAFVGAVGLDDFGDASLDALAGESISVAQVARLDRPTGVALIVVDANGQNQIAVAGGANSGLTAAMVGSAVQELQPISGDVVLVSREIPPGAVRTALAGGRAAGAMTILNPAPADGLDEETRRLADFLTPNSTELEMIGRTSTPAEAAASLLAEAGTRWLAVTLGAAGAVLFERGGAAVHAPAPRVQPLDTTGAGDTFNGALAALLAGGRSPAEAVAWAVTAASLSTLRAGARDGMPTSAQLSEFAAGAASSPG